MGGRKGKRDRTRREVCGRENGGDTGRYDEHTGIKTNQKGNQTFIKNNIYSSRLHPSLL